MNDGSKTRYDPSNGREEVLDLVLCSRDVLQYGPKFDVLEDIGSDHYPILTTIVFDCHQQKDPIFYRKVSQIDETRFKEIINSKVSLLPESFSTARELDSIAADLPAIVKGAYEDACPLKKVNTNKRPVNKEIMAMIKTKRRIWRQKSAALKRGDMQEAQKLQREMSVIGAQIKKDQRSHWAR